ncbi:MAG: NAD(P)-dependent oxidoreductase [Planctomycetes bacterium]|nr:NAD(P)-dependent oxidoreductase [Planctomycetota bacterium]
MRNHVGFIGLGIMGEPMALNVLKARFNLIVVGGHAKAALKKLASRKEVTVVDTPAAVAAKSDVVVTCLPDTPDVEKVVLGKGGLLDGAKRGLVIIDHSTISPVAAQGIAGKAKKQEVAFLDAPVSGGQNGAIAGTLSIMIGGDAKAVKKAMPVLKAMGKKIVHVGKSGAGQFTKCANQIVCAITWQAIGEGMTLGAKAGVDPAKMLEAISAGAARCWALEVRTPEVLKGNFKPGFMAKLQHKDLNIALATGKEVGVPLPVTAVVNEYYRAILSAGRGDLDTSALVTLQEDMARTKIRAKKK